MRKLSFKNAWNGFMVMAYIIFGIALIMLKDKLSNFPNWLNVSIGIIMIAYGIFRLNRLFFYKEEIEN